MPSAARVMSFTAPQEAKSYWDVINGKRHVVVPTVALLGNIVVRPMNSEVAEFVPASALSANASAWDGMPILWHHPNEGRSLASESQAIRDKYSFGHMRATRYANGALQTEACMDPEAAARIGEDAADRVRRCAEGEGLVDVSIGAMIDFETLAGSHNGKDYGITWRAVRPDHLAILPAGLAGACSVAAGCGAPRMMASRIKNNKETAMSTKLDKVLRALGLRGDDATPEVSEMLAAALAAADPEYNGVVEVSDVGVVYASGERLMTRAFTTAADGIVTLDAEPIEVEPVTRYEPLASSVLNPADLSNNQLQTLLSDALRDSAPGFSWVQDVFPSSRRVIYNVSPPSPFGMSSSSTTWRRSYALDANGGVALADDVEQVETVTTYEALAALVGKRHSAGDQRMVQTVHDHAVSLGAECAVVKAAARRGFATLAEISLLKGDAR